MRSLSFAVRVGVCVVVMVGSVLVAGDNRSLQKKPLDAAHDAPGLNGDGCYFHLYKLTPARSAEAVLRGNAGELLVSAQ